MVRKDKWKLLVAGGGISGIGLAREAGRLGIETLLLEKGRICQATSNNSLRIIHGGFRYLKCLDFPRLIYSLKAQTELLKGYPEFIVPLPCLMPLKPWGLTARVPLKAALMIHKVFAGACDSPLPPGGFMSEAEIKREIPFLKGRAGYVNGALLWHDAYLSNPAGFVERLRSEISDSGSEILEGSEARSVTCQNGEFLVEAARGDEKLVLRCDFLVNALGHSIDDLRLPQDMKPVRKQVLWCKAFNLLVSTRLSNRYALSFPGKDRLFFTTPRREGSAIGTWYEPMHGNRVSLELSPDEQARFLKAFNAALGTEEVKTKDVIGAEVGILPIKGMGPRGLSQYGREKLYRRNNYLEMLSTKYTTFLPQARKALGELGLI